MNQEKIGVFIAKCRKEKKLTQEQLNFIKDNYGKLKAREIATLLEVSTISNVL